MTINPWKTARQWKQLAEVRAKNIALTQECLLTTQKVVTTLQELIAIKDRHITILQEHVKNLKSDLELVKMATVGTSVDQASRDSIEPPAKKNWVN